MMMASAPSEPRTYTREELEGMTRDEVYAIAVERDISGRSSMTKPELIDAILLDQGGM